MATDLENTIEYYKDLLLYQYINQLQARGVIGLLISQTLVDLLPISLEAAFDIETALGTQLDIIGEYIGFSRTINTQLARDYLTFDDLAISPSPDLFGLTDYLDPLINANTAFYAYVNYTSSVSTLNDSEYRLLLKLKALLNISTNTLYDMNAILFEFFGTDLIVCDQLDMSLSYFVKPEISRIIGIAKEQNLLPKPMGVLICGVFESVDSTKLWGFSDYVIDNGFTTGFSDYVSGESDAVFLSYLDRI